MSIIRPLIVFAAMMLPWLRESLSPCSMLCGTIGLASRQRGRFAAAGRERQAAARRNHGIRLARPQGKLPEARAFVCGRPLRHGSIPCPIPGVGSSAFACPACRRGAFMVAAGLHGDARTGSKSLLRARRRLESPLVFPIPSRRLFALALSSVFPASPATPTSALSQAKVEPRNTPVSQGASTHEGPTWPAQDSRRRAVAFSQLWQRIRLSDVNI